MRKQSLNLGVVLPTLDMVHLLYWRHALRGRERAESRSFMYILYYVTKVSNRTCKYSTHLSLSRKKAGLVSSHVDWFESRLVVGPSRHIAKSLFKEEVKVRKDNKAMP